MHPTLGCHQKCILLHGGARLSSHEHIIYRKTAHTSSHEHIILHGGARLCLHEHIIGHKPA